MIELYTAATPNGRKISIALEELGLPYSVHRIDIGKGDQHSPEFTRLSPNQKIPAIVDQETGISLFESGAICRYVASEEKSPLYPADKLERARVDQWRDDGWPGVTIVTRKLLEHWHDRDARWT